ncbi:helicase SNF2 [Priestia megaterium]|nr:helicase SNF2 [Priestia megaterium]
MLNRTLNKERLKDTYSSRTYYRGHTYYKQGRVLDLEYNEQTETWIASVHGTELYTVMVEKQENSFYSFCDCDAYHEFKECKHEVAVLLTICDEQSKPEPVQTKPYRNSREYEKVNQFIQLFSDYQQSVNDYENYADKHPLKVEFICKSYSEHFMRSEGMYLTIELKVGVSRTYVVKDIHSFLMDVKEYQVHEFTKRFAFDPAEHYFIEEDRKVIELLQEMMENENLYQNTYSMYNSTAINRELIIPSLIAKRLLISLQDCQVTFIHESEVYEQILFAEDTSPFSFRIDKHKVSGFELDFSELHRLAFFDRYGWLFLNGQFYELTNEQRRLLEGLRKSAPLKPVIPIAEDQMGDFLSHVLPGLKKVGAVEITEEVSDKIISPPLKAKLFIDNEDDQIFLTLEYHYDDIVINPFAHEIQNYEKILIRDTEKEDIVMDLIEHAPLNIYLNQLYLNQGEDSIYEFLFRIIPQLENVVDVYMTDKVKFKIFHEYTIPKTSIDIESSNHLLEIDFDLGDIDEGTVQEVLQSVLEKKTYHRLASGAFISLESEGFQQIHQLFDELNVTKEDLTQNRIQVPLYKSMQVEDIMSGSNKANTKFGKAFKKLVNHLKTPEDIDWEIPHSLQASLRDYQYNGFQWFKSLSSYSLGGILADDMGLGKTLQSISYLLSEKQETDKIDPFLIVVPASLIYNWKNELEKFAPELTVQTIVGSPQERKEMLKSNADVWITSYPTLRQDADLYQNLVFHTLILDEAQSIKNYATKTAAAVRSITAYKRFALSGTPIENSLDELWSIFQTILPGFFPSQQEFKSMKPEQVSRIVRPFILRREKKDVLKELPDKIETTHLSELTKEQKELYVGYLEKLKASLSQGDFNKNRMKILAGLTRLRQICCHPSLFIENYEGQSSKLEQLLETVRNALANGKRLLIFSQFTSMLQIIREQLEAETISFFYLDGQTAAKDRVEMANRFNQGEQEVFLISLKAGGTGLNLTGADTVILYDLWWNPAIEEQAAGRAHRIGQKNVVQVIRLISRGTIEEKIYELQQKKKELIQQVIQPGETKLTSLSEEELRELLGM